MGSGDRAQVIGFGDKHPCAGQLISPPWLVPAFYSVRQEDGVGGQLGLLETLSQASQPANRQICHLQLCHTEDKRALPTGTETGETGTDPGICRQEESSPKPVSLPRVSVTHGQTQSKTVQWNIPDKNNS